MADEALNDPNGDLQDLLVTATYDYITEHGLPSNAEDMAWLTEPNYESVIAEYIQGAGGWSVDEWLQMITNVDNVRLEPNDSGGFDVHFDFDFESADGNYEGSRSV